MIRSTRFALSLLILVALGIICAGIAIDALAVENARLWLALDKTKAPEPGDGATVIEGEAKVVS